MTNMLSTHIHTHAYVIYDIPMETYGSSNKHPLERDTYLKNLMLFKLLVGYLKVFGYLVLLKSFLMFFCCILQFF